MPCIGPKVGPPPGPLFFPFRTKMDPLFKNPGSVPRSEGGLKSVYGPLPLGHTYLIVRFTSPPTLNFRDLEKKNFHKIDFIYFVPADDACHSVNAEAFH